MTITEKAKALRKELKEKLGLSSRKVSVKVDGYISINVIIKDEKALKYKKEIEKIAMKYKKVHYDEITGEILAGGNDFVFVEIDRDLENKLREKILSKLPYKSVKEFKEPFKLDKDITILNFDGERVGVDIKNIDYIESIKSYEDLGTSLLYILLDKKPEKVELFI